MHNISLVLQTALPVFAALLLGVLCRKRHILSHEGVAALKKLVVDITLPFVLFRSFSNAQYDSSALILPAVSFLTCSVMLALGFLSVRLFKLKNRLAAFFASGFEAGMLGFALFAMLYPSGDLSNFALLVLGQDLFVFTLYKILLTGKRSARAICKDLCTSPTLIAVFLGIVFGASGLYGYLSSCGIGEVLDSVTSFIAAPTGMVILLTIGFDLSFENANWKSTLSVIAVRVVIALVMASVLLVINHSLLSGMIFEGSILLLFILPPPYVLPIFADAKQNSTQISSALSVITLLTVILFAILSAIQHLS